MWAIKIIGYAIDAPCPWGNQYLREYDPSVSDEQGYGRIAATPDINLALHFRSPLDALDFWKQPSKIVPTRPDGRPNRPLTCFTVEIEAIPSFLERRTRRDRRTNPQELADLSAEVGRQLTEAEAEAYRRRKSAWDGVERRIAERRKGVTDEVVENSEDVP